MDSLEDTIYKDTKNNNKIKIDYKKLENILNIINNDFLLLIFLSLEHRKKYNNGKKIKESVLKFFEVYNKDINNIEDDPNAYWMNLLKIKDLCLKDDYRISEDCKSMQKFISYIIKQIIDLNIDTREIIKSTNIKDFIKIAKYIKDNPTFTNKNLNNALKREINSESYIKHTITQLKDLGLLIYIEEIYRVDLPKLKAYYNKINSLTSRNIKEYSLEDLKTIFGDNNKNTINNEIYDINYLKMIFNYISQNNKEIIDTSDFLYMGINNQDIRNKYIELLKFFNIIKLEPKKDGIKLLIKSNEKFYKFYENILTPIIYASSYDESESYITKYQYILSKEDRDKILESYLKRKV